VGSRVLVILPNPGVPTMFPGGPKFGWLNTSNASTRNCRLIPAPGRMFLMTEASTLWNAGPVTAFLPRVPNRSTATNVDGSNHWSTEPTIRTGPVTSGRTVFGTPLTVLLLVTMLTGLPLCDWTTAAICQPRLSACPVNGKSHIPLSTNRCRASKSERPYSFEMLLASWMAKPDELSEFVSSDFDQVYEASNWNPRESRFVTAAHAAL